MPNIISPIKFTQTSPSIFYRSSKRPYTLNDDNDRQISDAQILQKLQLILISMRQQSTKAHIYYQGEIEKLQSQVNQQGSIITLLQQENKLLRSHVNIYQTKFGSLLNICSKTQLNLKEQHEKRTQLIKYQLKTDKLQQQQNPINIKIDDIPIPNNDEKLIKNKTTQSKMSTKYESNIQENNNCNINLSSLILNNRTNGQQQQHYDHNNNEQTNSSIQYTDQLSQQCSSSVGSNFYKKTLPYYHHRRQSSLQQKHQSMSLYDNHQSQQCNNNNMIPLMITRCIKQQKTQISQISQLQSRKSTIIDMFVKSYEDNNNSCSGREQLQCEDSYDQIQQDQVNQLGLQSKGNDEGFFCCSNSKQMPQNKQQTLLLTSINQPQPNKMRIKNIARYVQSKQDINQQSSPQQQFNNIKEDSDLIKRMTKILQQKYGQNYQQYGDNSQQNEDNRNEQHQILIIHDYSGGQHNNRDKQQYDHLPQFNSFNLIQQNDKKNNISNHKKNNIYYNCGCFDTQKSTPKNNNKQPAIITNGQKKLRALFAPLSTNITSKKIQLPPCLVKLQKYHQQQHFIIEHKSLQQTQKSSSKDVINLNHKNNKKKPFNDCYYQHISPLQQAVNKLKNLNNLNIYS